MGETKRTIMISGFTDEIAPDFDVQLSTAARLKLDAIELRGINGRGVASYTAGEMEPFVKMLDQYGLHVACIGSPIGKIGITEDFEPHWESFKNVVEIAKAVNTRNIRMFSFFVDPEQADAHRDEVLRRMQRMVDYAAKHDVVLQHENEKEIYGDTASRCVDLMEHFYCDHFRAVFDFANFVQCGQDTLEAYEMLRKYVSYIHIKDAQLSDGQVVPPGTGDGHVRELLGRFMQSGYEGYLAMEPHLQVFQGFAALEQKDAAIEEEVSNGENVFTIATQALKSILWDLNWR